MIHARDDTYMTSMKIFSNKLWNNNRTAHVNEQNQIKNITKSRHIQPDHVLFSSI